MLKISVTTTRSNTGSVSDNVTFPIECPHCGHESEERLTGLKSDPLLTCAACSNQFKIETNGSAREASEKLSEIDRAIDNLFK